MFFATGAGADTGSSPGNWTTASASCKGGGEQLGPPWASVPSGGATGRVEGAERETAETSSVSGRPETSAPDAPADETNSAVFACGGAVRRWGEEPNSVTRKLKTSRWVQRDQAYQQVIRVQCDQAYQQVIRVQRDQAYQQVIRVQCDQAYQQVIRVQCDQAYQQVIRVQRDQAYQQVIRVQCDQAYQQVIRVQCDQAYQQVIRVQCDQAYQQVIRVQRDQAYQQVH